MCTVEDSLSFGNIEAQLNTGLFVPDNSNNFPYCKVKHKLALYEDIDMAWVQSALLRTSSFNHPDAIIGPALINSGCSTSCSPHLADFIDELEYGDFGRVHMADKCQPVKSRLMWSNHN